MRWISLLTVGLLLGGVLTALFSTSGGVAEARKLRQQLESVRSSNSELLSRNLRLEEEVRLLREDSRAVEETARAQFNMMRSDETLYLFSRTENH